MANERIIEFSNASTGITAYVVLSTRGGYNVVLHDDDADEYLPCWVNIRSLDDAIAKAKRLAED
jgi:hypothetical protein